MDKNLKLKMFARGVKIIELSRLSEIPYQKLAGALNGYWGLSPENETRAIDAMRKLGVDVEKEQAAAHAQRD